MRVFRVHGVLEGSAFAVGPNLLLTAAHVVVDSTGVVAKVSVLQQTDELIGTAECLAHDIDDDWALVQLGGPIVVDLRPEESFIATAPLQATVKVEIRQHDARFAVAFRVEDDAATFRGTQRALSMMALNVDGLSLRGLSGAPVLVGPSVAALVLGGLEAGGRVVGGNVFALSIGVVTESLERKAAHDPRLAQLLLTMPLPHAYRWLGALPKPPAEPYLGLRPFSANDRSIFFGRAAEVRALFHRATAPNGARIVLLHGQSGAGKSSLLAAGVVPLLEVTRAVGVARRERELPLGDSIRTASLAARTARPDVPVTVIVDQLEEIFTRPRAQGPEHELDALVQAISQLERTEPTTRLLLSFRKEWYSEIEARFNAHGAGFDAFFLERLADRRALIEAVRGVADDSELARHYRLTIEEGVAERIAEDLGRDRQAPLAPMLQTLLRRMWEMRQNSEQRVFDAKLYDGLRDRGLYLRDFVRARIESLCASTELTQVARDAIDLGLADDILFEHTNVGEEARARRQRAGDDVENAGDTLYAAGGMDADAVATTYGRARASGAVREVLGGLVDAHVLATSGGAGRTVLAHDTLAPVVVQRFLESAEPGQRARRILEARGGQSVDGALDAVDLAIVERGAPGMRQRTRAEEQIVHRSRDQVGRRRTIATGAVLAIVAAVLLAGGLAWQSYQADRANRDLARRGADVEHALGQQLVASGGVSQGMLRVANASDLAHGDDVRRMTFAASAIALMEDGLFGARAAWQGNLVRGGVAEPDGALWFLNADGLWFWSGDEDPRRIAGPLPLEAAAVAYAEVAARRDCGVMVIPGADTEVYISGQETWTHRTATGQMFELGGEDGPSVLDATCQHALVRTREVPPHYFLFDLDSLTPVEPGAGSVPPGEQISDADDGHLLTSNGPHWRVVDWAGANQFDADVSGCVAQPVSARLDAAHHAFAVFGVEAAARGMGQAIAVVGAHGEVTCLDSATWPDSDCPGGSLLAFDPDAGVYVLACANQIEVRDLTAHTAHVFDDHDRLNECVAQIAGGSAVVLCKDTYARVDPLAERRLTRRTDAHVLHATLRRRGTHVEVLDERGYLRSIGAISGSGPDPSTLCVAMQDSALRVVSSDDQSWRLQDDDAQHAVSEPEPLPAGDSTDRVCEITARGDFAIVRWGGAGISTWTRSSRGWIADRHLPSAETSAVGYGIREDGSVLELVADSDTHWRVLPLAEVEPICEGAGEGLAITSDGRFVASSTSDRLAFYETGGCQQVGPTVEAHDVVLATLGGMVRRASAITFDTDRVRLRLGEGDWSVDTSNGSVQLEAPPGALALHHRLEGRVSSRAPGLDPAGRWVITGDWDLWSDGPPVPFEMTETVTGLPVRYLGNAFGFLFGCEQRGGWFGYPTASGWSEVRVMPSPDERLHWILPLIQVITGWRISDSSEDLERAEYERLLAEGCRELEADSHVAEAWSTLFLDALRAEGSCQ